MSVHGVSSPTCDVLIWSGGWTVDVPLSTTSVENGRPARSLSPARPDVIQPLIHARLPMTRTQSTTALIPPPRAKRSVYWPDAVPSAY